MTTARMRIDCAIVTLSTRAPNRSASTAISAAPPGTLAKNAVVRSVPVTRLMNQAQTHAIRIASSADNSRKCQYEITCLATTGVKYRPSAVPMITCPTCRPPVGARSRAPLKLKAAITSSGPIIHGNGVFSHEKRAPATAHSARLTTGFRNVSRAALTCRCRTAKRFPRAGRPR